MSQKQDNQFFNDVVEKIASSWDSMAEVRNTIDAVWKWPSRRDCIRFAFQELAEADDEVMRSGDDGYLRRRDETGNSFLDEMGMCSVMLLSAFVSRADLVNTLFQSVRGVEACPDISSVAMRISLAWKQADAGDGHDASVYVGFALNTIFFMLGENEFSHSVDRALEKAVARVEYKKSKKYLYLKEHGVRCMNCGSDDIDPVGQPEIDDDYIAREVVCSDCGERWKDVYQLVDVKEEL